LNGEGHFLSAAFLCSIDCVVSGLCRSRLKEILSSSIASLSDLVPNPRTALLCGFTHEATLYFPA
jgi:hypothetical protein